MIFNTATYLFFAMVCLIAAKLHHNSHARHFVPGLLFLSITLGMEGLEYAWIFASFVSPPFGETAEWVYWKNVVTLGRLWLGVGFWLGARYSAVPMSEVGTAWGAVRFAADGWHRMLGETSPEYVRRIVAAWRCWNIRARRRRGRRRRGNKRKV